MPIKNADEPEDSSLLKALGKALNRNRDYEPLTEWCRNCTAISQKNTAALYRACLRIAPTSSIDNAIILMEVLKMTSRLELHSQEPQTFRAVRDHFDMACVKSLLHFKCNKQSASLWWRVHRDSAKLIVNEAHVTAAFAAEGSFASIRDILGEVVAGSCLGEKMFGRAFGACRDESIASLIQHSVA